ncbi:MAG: efflux RND transporter periplasmic adaptor subunit [Proteobacteria bacterium]|mgnify:CR=1 FL=1|nr:efflux RND transporter periplasmic adaptor subunit [Pseudomonadota bacterium]
MNTKKLLCRGLVGCALLALAAAPAWANEDDHTDPLTLDAKTQHDAGIVLATLGLRTLAGELKAPGEVKADAYATVLVSPRVEAQVIARRAKLGDVVKAGAALVVLSSVEVAAIQSELIVAEQDWQRIAALGAQAVSGRRYNEARAARDLARAKLRAYGVTAQQIDALLRKGSNAADGSFELLAPVAGRITTDTFLIGERIEPGRTLFTLVQEDSVWVEAQLAPADAARVQAGAVARVIAHGMTLPGTVVQRAHQTDAHTRTVPVRIAIDNREDLLHPGELVEARIQVGDGAAALAVPTEAVVLLQNQATVFVARSASRFEPVPVVAGETRAGWTAIPQGLKAGDSYVSQGAFVLKARLLRSQLGDHH